MGKADDPLWLRMRGRRGSDFHRVFWVGHPAAARSLAAWLAARFSQVGAFMYLYGQGRVCCGSVSLLRSRSFSFFLLLSLPCSFASLYAAAPWSTGGAVRLAQHPRWAPRSEGSGRAARMGVCSGFMVRRRGSSARAAPDVGTAVRRPRQGGSHGIYAGASPERGGSRKKG